MDTPEGKYIFGMVKMGEKGQIVIPKEARELFGFKPGDMLLILGDINQGLAIPKKSVVAEFFNAFSEKKEGNDSPSQTEKN